MSGTYTHRPVLLEECIQGLAIRPDGLYIDGTLGRGGHSEEIVKRLTQGGRLICIDRDSQAIESGKARLAPWAGTWPSCWTMPALGKRMGCSLTWASPPPS